MVPQPSYSPDLSPWDFFLFPKLKERLKGRHWKTMQNNEKLEAISFNEFQHCYEKWEQRLQRCVASQGDYFEGDKQDL